VGLSQFSSSCYRDSCDKQEKFHSERSEESAVRRREYKFWVYIMASKSRRLYTGVTSKLHNRVWQHKTGEFEGFTSRYNVHRLVYWASFDDVRNAIDREKQIKGWDRAKKVALIESMNPLWEDLAAKWYTRHRFQPETADSSTSLRSVSE
jgi:putative endonuclease